MKRIVAWLVVMGGLLNSCQRHDPPGLRNADSSARKTALYSRIGSKWAIDAVPDLLRCLCDESIEVREQATIALNQIGPPVLPYLREAFLDDKPCIRAGAFRAVGIPSPWYERPFTPADDTAILPLLIAASHDDNVDVRAAVCEALWPVSLGANQVPDGLQCLIHALKASDVKVLDRAASSIGFLARSTTNMKPFENAVEPLTTLLLNDDHQIRGRGAWALKELGPIAKDALPGLVTALEVNAESPPLGAIEEAIIHVGPGKREVAIPLLADAFRRERLGERRATILWLMRRIGRLDDSFVPFLVKCLHDSCPKVQRFAAITLGDMGTRAQDAVPALRFGLTNSPPGVVGTIAWAYFDITGNTEEAIPVLLRELSQADPEFRLNAVNGLGAIGVAAKGVVPVLRDLADRDPDPKVRLDARSAVRRILGEAQGR